MRASLSGIVRAAILFTFVAALTGPSAEAQLASLGNLVWNDLDNDGHFNGSETGIAGVTVELFSGDGTTLLDTTTTGAGGIYAFIGLSAGDYIVRLPAINLNPGGILRDYRSSTGALPTLGYEPAPDADADLTDSDDNGTETNGLLGLGGYVQSSPVTLTSGESENAVDFGVNNSPQIDLVVTKSDGELSYVPGGTLHYVIVVTNNGPADAYGMTVNDTRPPQIASWTWTCAPAYNCTGDATNPSTFTDSLDLPQLASVTYDVIAQVAPVVSGSLSNMVYVVPPAGMTDMTNPNNIATDTNALGAVDLSVTKTDGQPSYDAGGTANYTIVVINNGPADANGLTITDARPTQVTSWTWTCDAGTPPAYQCTSDAANPATFTDSLDLPALASVTYHVTAQIADVVAGDMTNSVQVTAPVDTPELDPADNAASDVDTLEGTTLSIAKSASPDPASAHSVVTYTIQVTNSGSAAATNLTVSDALPGSVTYISSSGEGWSCNETAGVVTCTRALLAPGGAPPILIDVQLDGSRTALTNSATASAGNASPASATIQTAIADDIPMVNGWGMATFVLLLAGGSLAILASRSA